MAWRGVVEVQKPMARMPVADRRPKADSDAPSGGGTTCSDGKAANLLHTARRLISRRRGRRAGRARKAEA
jgi:hypothetical protein